MAASPQTAASDDDANVTVNPVITGGIYKTQLSGVGVASHTITAAFNATYTTETIYVCWNTVTFAIPFNTSVKCPKAIWDVVSATGSGYTIL